VYIKDFEGWNKLKQGIDKGASVPTFREREIWWCSIGVNIGHETDGKNRFYNRPVLVVRKFNTRIFWGVPLTTQIKDNPFYFQIDFRGMKLSRASAAPCCRICASTTGPVRLRGTENRHKEDCFSTGAPCATKRSLSRALGQYYVSNLLCKSPCKKAASAWQFCDA
jgi:hypothetical protein